LNQPSKITDDRAPDSISTSSVAGHFKTREVVELLDLSRRQLQYWARTGLVVPSAQTPGGHHRYSFDDLVALKATKRLIDAGVSVQKIRSSVRALQEIFPQVGRPLGELVLVATGDVVLVFQDGTIFEAISGQEWVFPVAEFEREVAAYRLAPGGQLAPGGRLAPGGQLAPGGRTTEIEPDASMPEKPGPRGTRPGVKDWSQTG
jgi:DNA-binding transcriptional MerR regulator